MPRPKGTRHRKPVAKAAVSQKPARAKAKPAPPVPAAAKPKERVAIARAKGRPMLSWVGKRPLRYVTTFPAQHVESFTAPSAKKTEVAPANIWEDWPERYQRGGLLFHGDNKEVLAHLLANGFRGKVQLIYIDPPFDSGADYVRKVKLRGPNGKVKLMGESYTLGEQVQYTDIWANDNYLQFMFERLTMLRELLADGGSIFVHCDSTKGHHLRCLMDEVFGAESFVNEIIWSYRRWPSDVPAFQSMHDSILYYSNEIRTKRAFHKRYETASQSYLVRFGGKTQILDEESGTRKITSEEDTKGMPLRDVWELSILAGFKSERTGYPTQKPETLLERIIGCCSNPGDLVLDCFAGSGTAAAVAQRHGRRWIAADINKGAIQTTAKRIQTVMTGDSPEENGGQSELNLNNGQPAAPTAPPAQLSFTVHRVNDYDLAIQHNEAVNLACEHIGVTRTLADAFFDGTLGNKLVKIIPFGHALSPADLEDVKRELHVRPNESRDVVVVSLGKELAVDLWLADWNRMRKQGDTPNKIEVIELRSDPKYGKFIAHKPAQARVVIRRAKSKEGDKVIIEVKDFISPSITERLQDQAGLLAPKIPDWRAMVDSVMIDTAHDGAVFKIAKADVPERKEDYVQGKYELAAPAAETTVAVKVTDMLGEEVLVTAQV